MCEKALNLAKDNTQGIKQDKIRQYKYHSRQKMGYIEFGGKVGTKTLRCCFARKNT